MLWLLGNLTADSSALRDMVLERLSLLETLARIIAMPKIPKGLARLVTWVNLTLNKS